MNPQAEYIDGVDVSIIRWMLALTPSERLDVLEEFVDFVLEARKQNEPEPVPIGPPDAC
jgi:hypothetical protein